MSLKSLTNHACDLTPPLFLSVTALVCITYWVCKIDYVTRNTIVFHDIILFFHNALIILISVLCNDNFRFNFKGQSCLFIALFDK